MVDQLSPHPCVPAGGSLGLCPSGLHMLCESGEGSQPGPLAGSWEMLRKYGVPGPLLGAICSLFEHSGSCVCILGIKSKVFFPFGCWTLPRLPSVSDPLLGFHGQDLEAQLRPGVCLPWETQDYISAFC